MRHILLITSSPSGPSSISTRVAHELAEKLSDAGQHSITLRDLAATPLPHADLAYVQGRSLPAEERTPEQAESVGRALSLVNELKSADVIVIASAMINFAPPTQLKAWFDHVVWPGVTFQFGEKGAQGLISGKKVYLVTAAGGRYVEGPLAELDFQSGYLQHLLAFIGLSDIEHLRVEGVAYGPDAVEAALAQASADIERIAKAA
jgi:FMN-dependent NADH-azoreductase